VQIVSAVVLAVIGLGYLCCYCGVKAEKQKFTLPENPIVEVVGEVVKREVNKAVTI
jgi:hypothetical protein